MRNGNTLRINSIAGSREERARKGSGCAPDRIRTGTPPLLRGLPLPVGLRGQPQLKTRSRDYGRVLGHSFRIDQSAIRRLAPRRLGWLRAMTRVREIVTSAS